MRISDWSSDVCSSDLGHAHVLVDFVDAGVHRADLDALRAQRRDEARVGRAAAGTFFRRRAGEFRQHLARRGAQPALGREERLAAARSEEQTSELQSLIRTSYAVFCLKKKNNTNNT